MKCEIEGCENEAITFILQGDDVREEEYHYCVIHAHDEGFCYGCGQFWGGIEEFEFCNPSGLCPNCLDQLKAELEEDQDGDCGYYQTFDDPYNEEVQERGKRKMDEKYHYERACHNCEHFGEPDDPEGPCFDCGWQLLNFSLEPQLRLPPEKETSRGSEEVSI